MNEESLAKLNMGLSRRSCCDKFKRTDGSYSIAVYARDTAGNTGASEAVYFTIDTKQPEPFPTWIVGVAVATVAITTIAIAIFWRRKQPRARN